MSNKNTTVGEETKNVNAAVEEAIKNAKITVEEEFLTEEPVTVGDRQYIAISPYKVIFVNAETFNSAKQNKTYHRVGVVQLRPNGTALTFQSFLPEMPKICATLRFGDEVIALFGISDLDRKPDLVGIQSLTANSPFFKKA